jgi:PEP-CTERM/exosortase A-associated glycosyltransferase
MRILHILDHSLPLHSGYTFRTLAILQEQRRLHWETLQLTSPKQGGGAASEEVVEGWHFYRTPLPRHWPKRLPIAAELALMVALARRLEQVVRQQRPDILHAHSPVLNALPALYVGRRHGIPVLYEVRAFWEDAAVDHGTTAEGSWRYRLTRGLDNWVFRRVGHITTICEGLRQDIVARGIPEQRITVIPNAVDLDQFAASQPPDPALQQRLNLVGRTVLGFIGSFYAYEGLALLLAALPRLLAERPEVRLLLVGGGPQETALKQLAQSRGIADQVVFTGRVPHSKVQRYYDLIDILVYPRLSLRLTELVTPLKPLEAMAQGRLLVASDVGGHRELIANDVNGVLFRASDADDLVRQLLTLLAAPARWLGLKARARRFVEQERNWPCSVARYRQVYNRLLGHEV